MAWFLKNTIDWTSTDEQIAADIFELTGLTPDISNKDSLDIENLYLHDALYPKCTCKPDYLATEEEYRAIPHTNVRKGLF